MTKVIFTILAILSVFPCSARESINAKQVITIDTKIPDSLSYLLGYFEFQANSYGMTLRQFSSPEVFLVAAPGPILKTTLQSIQAEHFQERATFDGDLNVAGGGTCALWIRPDDKYKYVVIIRDPSERDNLVSCVTFVFDKALTAASAGAIK